MSKPWYEANTQARVYKALLATPTKSLDYDALCAALPDMPNNVMSQTLNRLKVGGYVRRGLALQGAKPAWVLVPGGPVPVIVNADGARVVCDANPAPVRNQQGRGELAQAAATMLSAHDAGYDSGALAQQLSCSAQQVDEALLPALLDNRLSSCRVMRYGVTLMHYRLSAGAAGYQWAEQCDQAWADKPEQLSAALAARAPIATPAPVAAAPVTAAPMPTPAPVPKPQPQPLPLPKRLPMPLPAPAPAPTVETASEVVAPAAPAAPAPKVPVVGEVDIDAAHRAVAFGDPEEAAFLAALYSNGKLTITSHGQRVTLPLEHTRQLLHYLDHLRCSDMVADMLGVLS